MKIKKLRNRLIWTLSGIIIGIGITFSLNYAQAGLKRFNPVGLVIEKLTLRKLDTRLKIVEKEIKLLKEK